jgi:hypothetical protein
MNIELLLLMSDSIYPLLYPLKQQHWLSINHNCIRLLFNFCPIIMNPTHRTGSLCCCKHKTHDGHSKRFIIIESSKQKQKEVNFFSLISGRKKKKTFFLNNCLVIISSTHMSFTISTQKLINFFSHFDKTQASCRS